jgi:hypothetical protein
MTEEAGMSIPRRLPRADRTLMTSRRLRERFNTADTTAWIRPATSSKKRDATVFSLCDHETDIQAFD